MINEIALRAKRDTQQEYTLHLFEYCNLSCSFCWQDHDNIIGINTVRNKVDPIEQFLRTETKDRVVFNIMGGEIFADEIFTDELFSDYLFLADSIDLLGKKYNKQVSINWVTNLVFDNTNKVSNLIKLAGGNLVTSYDPRGRFSKKNLQTFLSNLYSMRDMIEGIGIVLTKQNINYFLKGDDILEQLYRDGFYIYADYYMPDSRAEGTAPTDTELLAFFRMCIDYMPDVHPISEWINRDENYISCRSSKLILEDGTMCLCGNLVQSPEDKAVYSSDIQKADNSPIEISFLEKYNCLSCEYFSKCTMGCFMQHDYKWREELPECVYKMALRYVDESKRGIIARA